MLQCGLVRSNFSLAIVSYLRAGGWVVGNNSRGAGAGSGNRTRILSLEGCCTTIVLYPPNPPCGASGVAIGSRFSALGRPLLFKERRLPKLLARMVGEVGLEPTKAYARGFTVPPLCHSGHSPKHAMEFRSRRPLSVSTTHGKPSDLEVEQKLLWPVTDDAKSSAGRPGNPWGPKSERVL